MKPASLILNTLLAWVALVAAQIGSGMVIPISLPAMADRSGMLPWMLVADFLTAAVVAYVASRSDLRGWKLGAALASIPCAIAIANCVEGAVFLKNAGLPWTRIFGMSVLTYVLAAAAWAIIFGRRPAATTAMHPTIERTFPENAWRFVVSDFVYLILYFTAGTIIFPYVRDFYATQTVPAMPTISTLQLLFRGPIFVGICLLLARLLRLPRLAGALLTGLSFAILSGIVPLLVPNPIFPDTVRWVHMAEVTSSNFVFAFFVAWLWTSSPVHAVALPKAA